MSVSPGYVAGTGFATRFFEHDAAAAHDLFDGHAALAADDVARVVEQLLDSPQSTEYLDVLVEPREVGA
jgi:NADP-dependent 3-hydroxy acid dehydrogenase YdfG